MVTNIKIIKLIVGIFVSLLLLTISLNLNAQSYQTIADCKLRSGPGVRFKIVVVIRSGEKVNFIEKRNSSWFKIEYNRKIGFLSGKLLIPVVETPVSNEPIKVEDKPLKSNSRDPYIILGIMIILILLGIFSSRSKKKQPIIINQSANNKKGIILQQNFAKIPVINKPIDIQNKIAEPVLNTVINETYQKTETAVLDNLIKPMFDSYPSQIVKTNDDSVIDVTNNTYNLIGQNNLTKYEGGVPFWSHHYIYSYTEIGSASNEQTIFYNVFKKKFLNGEYLDLEGNTNYAFILLFELLLDYDSHRNINKLKSQLNSLGNFYPKTRPYAESFYLKKYKGTLSYSSGQSGFEYTNNQVDYDYWKLGSKYKTKLNLKDEEVKLLNKIWLQSNNFCNIEYCCIEVMKLYLTVIARLKVNLIEEQTTFEKELDSVVDIILRKHFRYHLNSFGYKNSIATVTNEIYSNIFKYCENTVREFYGHKRKINTDTYVTSPEAKIEFETKIIARITKILPTLIATIIPPDTATDIELYAQNTNRWKIKFEELTNNYNGNKDQFSENILSLGV
jgi:hypothetical protein